MSDSASVPGDDNAGNGEGGDGQGGGLSARMFRAAVDRVSSAIFITDRNGIIEYVNRAFTETSGFTALEAVGSPAAMLRSEATPAEVFTDMWSAITAGRDWTGELVNRRKDGSHYWTGVVISPVVADDGQFTHFVAVMDDITTRKRLEDDLRQLDAVDEVTGLINRHSFLYRLETEVQRARRFDRPLVLALVNIGPGARTDEAPDNTVLREAADTCLLELRTIDVVGRLSESEFAALLPETNLAGGAVTANRLRTALETMAPPDATTIEEGPTIRIGMAELIQDDDDGTALLARAALALRRAHRDSGHSIGIA
jgi:PAS domain S-box-containing protein/diguanylate cyclase (GGDEF)-like protein